MKKRHKRNIFMDMIRLILVAVLTIIFVFVDIKYVQGGKMPGADKGMTYASIIGTTVTEEKVSESEVSEPEIQAVTQNEEIPETVAELQGEEQTEAISEQVIEYEEVPVYTQAPEGYFSDALFIGDSRTLGLYEYGGIEGADFFATDGMSVFTVNTEMLEVGDKGWLDFSTLMTEYTYGKIYVMLGINELGYPEDELWEGFASFVEQLRQAQPEAILFLQANQHVSQERSQGDAIFNNDNISRLNEYLESLADNENIFYIDVNEVYDDENGSLRAELTKDGIHVLAKHYHEWAAWLESKAVVK